MERGGCRHPADVSQSPRPHPDGSVPPAKDLVNAAPREDSGQRRRPVRSHPRVGDRLEPATLASRSWASQEIVRPRVARRSSGSASAAHRCHRTTIHAAGSYSAYVSWSGRYAGHHAWQAAAEQRRRPRPKRSRGARSHRSTPGILAVPPQLRHVPRRDIVDVKKDLVLALSVPHLALATRVLTPGSGVGAMTWW
jgi:hypothetical protein